MDDVFSREIGKFLKSGKIIEAFDFANENGESIKEVINKVTNNIHSISTGFVEEYNLNYIELNNMYSQLMLSSNAEDSRKIKYQIEEKTQVLHDLLNQNIKQRKVNNQNYFNEDIKCIYKLSFEDVNLLAA